jgi:hypothetical protein
MPGSLQPNGLRWRFGQPRVSRSPAKAAIMTHMATTTAAVGTR